MSRHLSTADRVLIDAALAAGRVQRCPPAIANGITPMEQVHGVVWPYNAFGNACPRRATARAEARQATPQPARGDQ